MTGIIETSKLSQRVLTGDEVTIKGTFKEIDRNAFGGDGLLVIDISELRFE